MLRKLLVNVMALFAVLVVAGGAMAAVGTSAQTDDDCPDVVVDDDTTEVPVEDVTVQADVTDEDCDEPAESNDDDDQRDLAQAPTDDLDGEDSGESANFGEARAAEVQAYQDCRAAAGEESEDAAADDDALDVEDGADDTAECEKPGPAWQNPQHPVFGENGKKAGQTPGDKGRAPADDDAAAADEDDEADDSQTAAVGGPDREDRAGKGHDRAAEAKSNGQATSHGNGAGKGKRG